MSTELRGTVKFIRVLMKMSMYGHPINNVVERSGRGIGRWGKRKLMNSTAFVASCLVISMIAAQNSSRRDLGTAGRVASLVKGTGKLV
jgi:hypothetical protein